MDELKTRLQKIKERLAKAEEESGRPQASVRLIAVSKTQPVAKIRAMYQLGLRDFGENYAQELVAKRAACADLPLRLVFIGRLQSNKIKSIVRHADEIQSVASLRHAQLIAAEATKLGKTPYPIYLLVNAGDEASKAGVPLDLAPALGTEIREQCPALDLLGVMAIPPPLEGDHGESPSPPPLYRTLRDVASQVGRGRLSLGMSDDLEIAVAAGSDCIRIGTALFGPRGLETKMESQA